MKTKLIKEAKRFQQLAGIIPLHESEQTNYDLVLNVVKSHEDDDVLNDFNNTFQQGHNISKEEFFNFFEQHMDDMSELSDIEKNWKFVESGGDYSIFDGEDGYEDDFIDKDDMDITDENWKQLNMEKIETDENGIGWVEFIDSTKQDDNNFFIRKDDILKVSKGISNYVSDGDNNISFMSKEDASYILSKI